MDIITILFIAFGLSMDAFAVSVTSGITTKNLKLSNILRIALFFGSFQAIMPLLGWLAGLSLRSFICGVDHWIAFGLLTFVGCKMIYESAKIKMIGKGNNPLDIYVLLILSVATSIDALAVGLSLSFLNIAILTPIIIIGIVTFVLSFIGTFIGKRLGSFFEHKIEIAGGVILIGIGLKILIEHLK